MTFSIGYAVYAVYARGIRPRLLSFNLAHYLKVIGSLCLYLDKKSNIDTTTECI